MRRRLGRFVLSTMLLCGGVSIARAQNFENPYRMNGPLAAPGLYGMSYGVASYGVPRTFSQYSSPYQGGGYGYGYAPYGMMPGRYGVGLWRPGFSAPGYTYGASYYYGTFPVRNLVGQRVAAPPVGWYAPAFGAPSYVGW